LLPSLKSIIPLAYPKIEDVLSYVTILFKIRVGLHVLDVKEMQAGYCVFLSHTKLDSAFCDRFDNICANVGIRRFRSEFAYIEKPSWRTIKEQLGKSRALFLLVGKQLVEQQASPYNPDWRFTQNWISYEVGIAHQRNIDVWVVCDSVGINFPVPYFNNYKPDGLEPPDAMEYMEFILGCYQRGQRFSFRANQESLGIHCPTCAIGFNLHSALQSGQVIICPQCLHEIEFLESFPPSLRG